ncbi:MAG: hypothetical protein ABI220_05270 [Candidatus Saccharimonadales bacterium]
MNILLIVGAAIGTLGILPYITAVRRGQTRPRLVTWSVWTVLATIMAIASFRDGQTASAILALEGVIGCGAVAIMGIRYGNLKIDKIDIISMIGAGLGLISLTVIHQPMVTILITITIDGVAFVPTFIHGWTRPSEETAISYTCGAIAAGLSLIVALAPGGSMTGALYPLYSTVANGLMVSLVLLSRTDWRQYLARIFSSEISDSTESL